ncbi:unnamed protein product [Phytophthora lilii]|uniref:Unnamed protein product n=1 Tax=Phytophthora lilii TaxID=2077276 RepID=A0A9W6YKT3_9STRA|nr:unnamed protein product [Phytophthora lilii]
MVSVLSPPNCEKLSDRAIGVVVERIQPKRLDDQRADQSPSFDPITGTKGYTPIPSLKALKKIAKEHEIEFRRMRNRQHQAKYKKKQRLKLINLESSVQGLREHIQQLEQKRQVLYASMPTNSRMWGIAAEYFRLFRHGFRAPMLVPDVNTTPQSPNLNQSCVAGFPTSNDGARRLWSWRTWC